MAALGQWNEKTMAQKLMGFCSFQSSWVEFSEISLVVQLRGGVRYLWTPWWQDSVPAAVLAVTWHFKTAWHVDQCHANLRGKMSSRLFSHENNFTFQKLLTLCWDHPPWWRISAKIYGECCFSPAHALDQLWWTCQCWLGRWLWCFDSLELLVVGGPGTTYQKCEMAFRTSFKSLCSGDAGRVNCWGEVCAFTKKPWAWCKKQGLRIFFYL